MATVDSASSVSDPISLVKENLKPMNGRMKELQESRAELMNRFQSLKQVFPLKAELLKPQEQMERHITDLIKK
ncbi:hypothetical protein Droror1_Dr00025893, partial [Drosera rotundifolia]